MRIFKLTVAFVLACVMTLGGVSSFAEVVTPLSVASSTDQNTNDVVTVKSDSTMVFPSEQNPFVEDYYVGATDQSSPFFETILPAIKANIKENDKHSISPYYDAFPVANNPQNFQGLGSTTYANINGKTVTAEAFYRLTDEGLNDPNCGMGLLIFQCIQYKLKHPEEDVKITYSSYRTSATAAVCVIPESKYYGYMRSLYGTNFDEHGFVRVSYMLVEAARMGIEVTMINQLETYAVYQYNPTLGKLKWRDHIDYKKYFAAANETDCYNKYAQGKKVSDFLSCVTVGWTVNDQTAFMQHIKSAAVSHYLATDGTEHTAGVYFASTNFDENSYIGANGNNGSQSGVIVSDHDELFRVTYNYMKLMKAYSRKEQMQELRFIAQQRNEEQIALIKAGRGDEIPRDEQIVYIGTENDNVFELYFTPLGGGTDTWAPDYNPFCNYMNKFAQSEDYVEFIWNEFGYGRSYVGYILEKQLARAFCNNPNPKNILAVRIPGLDTKAIEQLELGTQIGYRSVKNGHLIHSKDIIMSYVEEGERHYVSLMTSCNFYMIAFNYRTNSILVINENELTGDGFYKALGRKFSYGAIQ